MLEAENIVWDLDEPMKLVDVVPIVTGEEGRARFKELINAGGWQLAENGLDSAYAKQRINYVREDPAQKSIGLCADEEFVVIPDHDIGFVFDMGGGVSVEKIEVWLESGGEHVLDVQFINDNAIARNRAAEVIGRDDNKLRHAQEVEDYLRQQLKLAGNCRIKELRHDLPAAALELEFENGHIVTFHPIARGQNSRADVVLSSPNVNGDEGIDLVGSCRRA